MDPRIPTAYTSWHLWYSDIFDRESLPSVQASGENIILGLYELWSNTLKDGIQDNGSATFSRYFLTWGDQASMRVDIRVDPFNNLTLVKLRQWANLMSQDQALKDFLIAPDLAVPRVSIINRLAQWHLELLLASSRWKAAAIDWSAEASELLTQVALMTDSKDLQV